ncbi:MAG: hypothetical protein HW421_1241 [Ignavibacteria bacterium]|nr:hypothetical protein [Ignavibacteria bacterium]
MAEPLRILQLVPQFPFPMIDGGKIGIASILREFSRQGAEVTLFYLSQNEPSEEALKEARQYCEPIMCKYSTKNTARRIIASVLYDRPIYVAKHENDFVFDTLKKNIENRHFDIIHADHSSMAPLGFFAKQLLKKPVGLRLHNVEWLIWKRYSDSIASWNPKKLYLRRQAHLLRKEEVNFYSSMDICFAITDKDRDKAISMAPNAKIVIASAGVDTEDWKPKDYIRRNPYELVLAAYYKWVHNVDAVRWFVDEVLPIVKERFPETTVFLIGKDGPSWFKHIRSKGVFYIGFVPKVQPYLNRAAAYVAPLFVGSGIRIKILEAMAMELPVVSTPIGAEGINCTENEGLFIARDAQGFANQIIKILANREFSLKAGKSAREFIVNNYSWNRNVGIMLEEYEKLANKQQ